MVAGRRCKFHGWMDPLAYDNVENCMYPIYRYVEDSL